MKRFARIITKNNLEQTAKDFEMYGIVHSEFKNKKWVFYSVLELESEEVIQNKDYRVDNISDVYIGEKEKPPSITMKDMKIDNVTDKELIIDGNKIDIRTCKHNPSANMIDVRFPGYKAYTTMVIDNIIGIDDIIIFEAYLSDTSSNDYHILEKVEGRWIYYNSIQDYLDINNKLIYLKNKKLTKIECKAWFALGEYLAINNEELFIFKDGYKYPIILLRELGALNISENIGFHSYNDYYYFDDFIYPTLTKMSYDSDIDPREEHLQKQINKKKLFDKLI